MNSPRMKRTRILLEQLAAGLKRPKRLFAGRPLRLLDIAAAGAGRHFDIEHGEEILNAAGIEAEIMGAVGYRRAQVDIGRLFLVGDADGKIEGEAEEEAP